MPPKYRVAEPVGTPVSPPLDINVSNSETLLIVFAIGVMLLLGTVFLLGVWFFVNRLKKEQEHTNRIEQRASSQSGTGSRPDTPPPGRDFVPQAEMHVRDD